jgi:predicted ATPase
MRSRTKLSLSQRDDSLRYLRAPSPPGLTESTWATPNPFALAPHTSLIGRDDDLAAARGRVLDDRVRLLTLTGPGGVGKTRLALALAEELAPTFTNGVVVVPLAAIWDPALVLPTIASAVGLREVGPGSLDEALFEFLRHRHVLLLLDNVEQVPEAGVPLAQLITACPGITAIVTSRTRLRVAEEQRFPVVPLAVPATSRFGSHDAQDAIAAAPAVQLFLDRAQAVDPAFRLDGDNAETVAAICRRLDGLPLAIELAAARTRMLSPTELLARLDPALPLLTDGPVDAPHRLRTMRQAIAWSYDLLTPAERTALRRLAVFVGGHSLEAAEAVVGDGGDPIAAVSPSPKSLGAASAEAPLLETLAGLIDASMIERYEVAGASWFRM